MSFSTINQILSADLVTAGTITVTYPSGKNKGSFYGTTGHKIVVSPNDVYKLDTGDFTISLGDTSATITWKSTTTIPAGTQITTQLEEPGERAYLDTRLRQLLHSTTKLTPVMINLGNPIAPDPDGLVKAATSTELPNAETVTYTFPATNVSPMDAANQTGTLDVPRNITAAATHGSSVVAMTIVVTGEDEYGDAVVETLAIAATGTSQSAAGKKAFKTVASIAITAAADAEANTLNVGFGDVFGIPFFIPNIAYIVKELEDGAAATAGTFVGGVLTIPTATTGDVRGTYDPNSAADGTKIFRLLALMPDTDFLGLPQYSV